MQELRRTLLKKGKTMAELKYSLRSGRLAMIHQLKSLQKQQALNQIIQNRILSDLDSNKFQTKQELQKLYQFSFSVMKSLSKKFEFVSEENYLYTKIVEMHCKFYESQGDFETNDRIKYHMRSNPMQKKILLKKLVQWLHEWVKNKFQEALTQALSMIDPKILTEKVYSPVKVQQNLCYLNRDEKQKKYLTFNEKTMNLFSTEVLQRKLNKSEFKAVTQKNPSLFTEQSEIVYLGNQQNEKCYDISTRISTSYDPQKSVELVPKTVVIKKRSVSYNRGNIEKQKSVSFVPHINKEIFYGAFNQQFNQLYKSMSDVMEVDSYYLCSFRRQKEELKNEIIFNRIDEVVDLIVKNMPQIQKPVNKYSQEYDKNCPAHIKAFHYERKTLICRSIKPQNPIFLLKSHRERFSLSQKLKSEEIFNKDKEIQKLFKNSKTNKLRQRNKSFQERMTRKSSQEKTQVPMKFPVVYNPDAFYPKQDIEAEKVITIHKKLQNFTTNINKLQNNKGLVRYKVLIKDREKNVIEDNLIYDKAVSYGIDLFETKKLNEFQVANIRQLLRIREKQRASVNKSPITYSVKQKNEELDNLMNQVRAIESQRSKNLNFTQNTSRYQVFLNTLNENSFKSNEPKLKSKFVTQSQSKDIYLCLTSRNKEKDHFPKLI